MPGAGRGRNSVKFFFIDLFGSDFITNATSEDDRSFSTTDVGETVAKFSGSLMSVVGGNSTTPDPYITTTLRCGA